ncbi:hypothetical protein AVI51_12495 [Piscirickettsia salmonis]|uniref:DUF748 domain-containing protein n=1 Tax=Piscirickettsia salmonis TaxID=1238 RepID=UPI0002FF8871|nr:hypothetical protein [Piscirickettsia salmonis]ALA26167.1 hypothetical protein KW89_2705 [Piscirickettsia salmonis]APS43609.1 hypothetical protein AVI48_03980 [Piscirickettsia salmonis]APS46964.1 hypothetical protein AVI49_04590 [Piscirickettsia salmonis]APS51587.1 hypothetical protein AVI50_12605 [Piscirickettsia salmonis]APS54801.1 hypothetical protein AVI51_12495 [Piscirickettsia salmonis]
MAKKIFYSLIIVILLLVVGSYFLFSHMDSILRSAVEKIGSKTTGTTVTLGSLKTSLKEGQVSLSRLTMSNPAGFSQANAISFKDIMVNLDPSSATQQTIVLNKVIIKDPYLLYEMKEGSSRSNLQQIQKNIQSYFASKQAKNNESNQRNSGVTQQEPSQAKVAAKNQKKFIIKELEILAGQVKVISPLLKSKEKTLSLPNIRLTNIGTGGSGLTPDQVTEQIINVLVANSGQAVAQAGLDRVKTKLKEKASGLLNNLLGNP